MMEITLQYFEGCPNWQTTEAYLAALIGEGLDVTVDHELIDSHEEAVEKDFHGSPTVLIGGVDPFADEHAPVGLACRVYPSEKGPAGSPSILQLRRAITSAARES